MDIKTRQKAVLCMDYIARLCNDEAPIDTWLSLGVADGDINHSVFDYTQVDEWYTEDDNFAELMHTFLYLMMSAAEGGLYCDGIVSAD